MSKHRSETQIIAILKEQEAGMDVSDICRKHGIGQSTFYQWRSKYGGMEASDTRRLKELETENRRLKQVYAELQNAYIERFRFNRTYRESVLDMYLFNRLSEVR